MRGGHVPVRRGGVLVLAVGVPLRRVIVLGRDRVVGLAHLARDEVPGARFRVEAPGKAAGQMADLFADRRAAFACGRVAFRRGQRQRLAGVMADLLTDLCSRARAEFADAEGERRGGECVRHRFRVAARLVRRRAAAGPAPAAVARLVLAVFFQRLVRERFVHEHAVALGGGGLRHHAGLFRRVVGSGVFACVHRGGAHVRLGRAAVHLGGVEMVLGVVGGRVILRGHRLVQFGGAEVRLRGVLVRLGDIGRRDLGGLGLLDPERRLQLGKRLGFGRRRGGGLGRALFHADDGLVLRDVRVVGATAVPLIRGLEALGLGGLGLDLRLGLDLESRRGDRLRNQLGQRVGHRRLRDRAGRNVREVAPRLVGLPCGEGFGGFLDGVGVGLFHDRHERALLDEALGLDDVEGCGRQARHVDEGNLDRVGGVALQARGLVIPPFDVASPLREAGVDAFEALFPLAVVHNFRADLDRARVVVERDVRDLACRRRAVHRAQIADRLAAARLFHVVRPFLVERLGAGVVADFAGQVRLLGRRDSVDEPLLDVDLRERDEYAEAGHLVLLG